MTTTNASDLIVPDVFADIVQAKFPGKLVLGQFATTEHSLEGQPGETITFPSWNALTDADILAEGTPMTPEKMTQDDDEATIVEAGKAVEVTDKAMLTGIGDPIEEAANQFSTVVARRIDLSLAAAAVATSPVSPLSVTRNSSVLNGDAIVDGLSRFGDDADLADFDGIVVHSRQYADLLKDDDFIKATSIAGNTVLTTGFIGQIYGLNVYVSDRVPTVDIDADAPVDLRYKALILKKGALGLIYKRRPIVEKDRDVLARTTVLTTNVHYATKRLNHKGIVVVQTNVGAIAA